MRRSETATAAAFVVLAAVAMFDSRDSALIASTTKFPGGIGPGFYPFWAAAVMGGAALVILIRLRVPSLAAPKLFENRASLVAVGTLIGPLLIATAAMTWLGFYIVCAVYTGFFARYIGRYRWVWSLAIGILFPVITYVAFEMAFRVRLPKSTFYEMGLLF